MSGFANELLTNSQLLRSLSGRAGRIRELPYGGWAQHLGNTLQLWRRRIQERRALAELDDRELRDFGRSRGDIQGELAKPFWRG